METWQIAVIAAGVVVAGVVGYAILSDDESSSRDDDSDIPSRSSDDTAIAAAVATALAVVGPVVQAEPERIETVQSETFIAAPAALTTVTEKAPEAEVSIDADVIADTTVTQSPELDPTVAPLIDPSPIILMETSEQGMLNLEAYRLLRKIVRTGAVRVLPNDRIDYFEGQNGGGDAVMLTRKEDGGRTVLYQIESFFHGRECLRAHNSDNPFIPITGDYEISEILTLLLEATDACGKSDEEMAQTDVSEKKKLETRRRRIRLARA